MKLIDAEKRRKIIAFPFAASLIIFFIGVNLYRGYILDTYGRATRGHGSHGGGGAMSHMVSKERSPHARSAQKRVRKVMADDTVYFSERDPSVKKRGGYGGHMHRGARGEVPTKKVWPVFRDQSGKEHCFGTLDGQLYLLDANLKSSQLKPSKGQGCKSVSFKMPDNGYYDLYYIDKMVNNGTLYVNTAKYEYLRFNHSNDAVYDKQKMAAHTIKEAPLDILRLRDEDETFYHRLYSGEKIRLKVVHNAKPVEGANITLSTKTGWSKTVKTDKEGKATFSLIKDYFPEWEKFDRRHKNEFLLTASYVEERKGEHNGTAYEKVKYTATYPSVYYPGKSGYTSYAYGLLAAFAAIILSGLLIYGYRRKRTKPFKEVYFEEKD
jgi:hypothetical protein